MLKRLRFLTVNPMGGMPGWAKEEEKRILERMSHRREAVRVAAENDEEVMRERNRRSQG